MDLTIFITCQINKQILHSINIGLYSSKQSSVNLIQHRQLKNLITDKKVLIIGNKNPLNIISDNKIHPTIFNLHKMR